MSENSVSLGNKVDIIRKTYHKKDGTEERVLSSKVVDIINNITYKLMMPLSKTLTIPLDVGEETTMNFYVDNAILSARTIIKDRFFEENIAVIVVELITGLEKIQRRQFYRLQCQIEAKIQLLTKKESERVLELSGTDRKSLDRLNAYFEELAEKILMWEDVLIIDLSGGGIKYLGEKERKLDDYVLVLVSLEVGGIKKEHKILMRVVSSNKKRSSQESYEIGGSFVGLRDRERDNIVRFIFEEERKNRRKENRLR